MLIKCTKLDIRYQFNDIIFNENDNKEIIINTKKIRYLQPITLTDVITFEKRMATEIIFDDKTLYIKELIDNIYTRYEAKQRKK
jgi:hypothetical protein